MSLANKVQNALDEGRMLVLGVQVLLGFQFRAFFEPGFEQVGRLAQLVELVGLVLLETVVGLMLMVPTRHRIVEKGEDTLAVYRYARDVGDAVLLPFALALGTSMYVAALRSTGSTPAAAVVAGITAIGAGALWYALPAARARLPDPREAKEEPMARTDLDKRIRHALTEARVVLPGSQALLGFQAITTMLDAFARLPASSKIVHLASLCSVAVSVIVLMLPAAFHRIAERGEDTERFHRLTGVCVLAALPALGLGMAGDLFVVFRLVTGSPAVAIVAAATLLAALLIAWFAVPIRIRARERKPGWPRQVAASGT